MSILGLISISLGLIASIWGYSQQQKAQESADKYAERQWELSQEQWELTQKAYEEQRKATIAGWESQLRTHEYNIERIGIELIGKVGDIRKEGERFQSYQLAYMGASGATVGVGTPLMNMIETAAGIETDIRNLERLADLERDYLESEIAATEELLLEDEPEPAEEEDRYTFDPTAPHGGPEDVDPSYPGTGEGFIVDPSLFTLPFETPLGEKPKKKKKKKSAPGATVGGGMGAGLNMPGVPTEGE